MEPLQKPFKKPYIKKPLELAFFVPTEWLTHLGLAEDLQADIEAASAVAKKAMIRVLDNMISSDQYEALENVNQHTAWEESDRAIFFSLPPPPDRYNMMLQSYALEFLLTPAEIAKRIIGMAALGQFYDLEDDDEAD